MKFITNKISVGAAKSFEQLVADFQAKKSGQVKTASSDQRVVTAEGVERSDAKQEEGKSSGQLEGEPLHQNGESTPKVKGKSGKDKDQGIKDKVVSNGKAQTKAAESSIVDKDNENNDDADESGQTKADFPKLTNDPKAGEHRDGDGDQKEKKEAAGVANFGDKKAKPFGSKEDDKGDKKDKKKDCPDGSKKEDCKKDASAKRKFVRIANLDSKSKSWLKKYWTKVYMGDYADAMTADK